VAQAGQQVESQQAIGDFFAGVSTGMAVGVLAETTVAAAGIALTLEVVAELGAEAVEGLVAAATKAGGPAIKSVPDLAPALKSVEALTQLDRLNASVLGMAVPGSFVYSGPIVEGERLIAELRVAEAGGPRRIPDAELQERYLKLMSFDVKGMALSSATAAATAKFQALRAKLSSRKAPTDLRCEQDIWIPWIAAQGPAETSFWQVAIPLNNKLLTNHFVDIGLATRGRRGGRLNADIENPGISYPDSGGISTSSPPSNWSMARKQR
jgi:hypothetical protein